jgi:hypothetical protein
VSWMAKTLVFPSAAYFRTYCSWASLLISATSSGLYAVPSLRKISWNHTAGSRSVYGCLNESQGRYVCVLPATRPGPDKTVRNSDGQRKQQTKGHVFKQRNVQFPTVEQLITGWHCTVYVVDTSYERTYPTDRVFV